MKNKISAITVNYKSMMDRQGEWGQDYPWFIKRVKGDKILDLGFMSHWFFTWILCEYGFSVTGVDLREPNLNDWKFKTGKFSYIKADVRKISLPDNTFDSIIAPSLIEHIGSGYYGDKPQKGAWKVAIAEWHRLLKPNGVLLVQIPYGAKTRIISKDNKPFYQIYTASMIEIHFQNFIIEEITYQAYEPHGWIEVSQSVADHIDHTKPYTPCIAQIILRKHQS